MEKKRKSIDLLDCTLGLGGKLIEWGYGEKSIRDLHSLLGQSRLDIIELGLLQSHTKGPQFAIYSSSRLPSSLARGKGQKYAAWMSEDRIDLAGLPEHSGETVDIIRVPVAEEGLTEDLSYCAGLRKKGYSVAVMLEDTAQYSKEQLCGILKKIGQIMPWACYIMDGSGVMAKAAYQNASSHPVCIDVSADGMGVGGRGLSAKTTAEWLNETCDKKADVYVLRYLEEYVKPYVEPKKSPVAQLVYHLSAEQGCSYRYVEYFLSPELQLDVSVIGSLLSEIPREEALRFSKKTAIRALRAYRKKKLDLIIVVPTSQNWKAVDSLLFSAARELQRYGVDIEIYDSSKDDKTHVIVANFQIDGLENVFYRRYEGESDGFSLDQKVISAFNSHLDRDYIWVCRDGMIPRIGTIYDQLVECAEKKTDLIVVDAAFRNNMHFISRTYDNCLDFFVDNSARTTDLGSCIFRKEAIRAVIEHQPPNESNYSLWHGIAPLQEMAVHPLRTKLIVDNSYDLNPFDTKRLSVDPKTMERWGKLWYNAVSGLPDVYDEGKTSALRIQMSDFHPFHLQSLLRLRGEGFYSLRIYRQYRQYLPHVCDTPAWKFYLAAMTPRLIARSLAAKESSPFMQKILAAYRKI